MDENYDVLVSVEIRKMRLEILALKQEIARNGRMRGVALLMQTIVFLSLVGLFLSVYLPGCGAYAPSEDESAYCEPACAKLEQFRCLDTNRGNAPGPDALNGTEDDVPCLKVCTELEAVGADLFAKCIAESDSCEAIEACAKGGW